MRTPSFSATLRFFLAAITIALVGGCGASRPQSDNLQPGTYGATLMDGMGTLHHSIRTSNPECQRFFDQGLTLAFALNFKAALASFTRAAQLDSHAAMPYWGIAMTFAPNYNQTHPDPFLERAAFDAIHRAIQLLARWRRVEGSSQDSGLPSLRCCRHMRSRSPQGECLPCLDYRKDLAGPGTAADN